MDHFQRRNGVMFAEDVALSDIAEAVGTPVYVYATQTILRHIDVFAEGFAGSDYLVAFAVKSLSNLSVLELMASRGVGADIVSGGEMVRALKAGIPSDRIVFSGVGKTPQELSDALDAGVGQINVESAEELEDLSAIAADKGCEAPVALRVNPNVDAGTLDKISTGRGDDKFGIPFDRAREVYRHAASLPGISAKAIAMHIGSQITSLAPFEHACSEIIRLLNELRADGHQIETLDVGGGLGIPYESTGGVPPTPKDYAALIRRMTADLGVKVVLEPGRLIAGNAGVLLTEIIRSKRQTSRTFVVVDAAMNDLIRPALYNARHETVPVRTKDGDLAAYDVAGPVCESTDIFAKDVMLVDPKPGDLLVMRSAGAYGAVQASQYNTRPLVPEVLVDGDQFRVVRRRPTIDEMLALELE